MSAISSSFFGDSDCTLAVSIFNSLLGCIILPVFVGGGFPCGGDSGIKFNFQYKIENGNIALEINSYNFRRTNFDEIRTELDYQTFEELIVRNNTVLGFEIFKN